MTVAAVARASASAATIFVSKAGLDPLVLNIESGWNCVDAVLDGLGDLAGVGMMLADGNGVAAACTIIEDANGVADVVDVSGFDDIDGRDEHERLRVREALAMLRLRLPRTVAMGSVCCAAGA